MPAAAKPVNAQSTSLGVTIRRVIVEQVVPERGVAIVRDDQQFATEIPYRVQQGRGRMPRVGDYWYVDRSMGPWVFSAYIAKNDTDIGTFADGEQIRIGTLPSPSTAVIAARVAGGTPIIETGVNGDVVPQYTRYANGRTEWGPGGSASRDTFLYRSASATLKTDGALAVGGALTTGSGAVTGALSVGGALTAASVHVTGSTTLDGTLSVTGELTASGDITLPVGSHIYRGIWVNATLGSGWSNYGNGFSPVSYCEMPDNTGQIKGACSGGTTTDGTVLFTLPSSIRPSYNHTYLCATSGSPVQIRVNSSGTVVIQNPVGTITWIALDGVQWQLGN
jgi:hypothetical protein